MLPEQTYPDRSDNTREHCLADLYPKQGQDHDDDRREDRNQAQTEYTGKAVCKSHAAATHCRKQNPADPVKSAGQKRRNKRSLHHQANIVKNVCVGQLRDQQRAGGYRRTPVPEEHAGEDRAACKDLVAPHCLCHRHTDHTHGRRCTKCRSSQDRNQSI